MQCVNDVGSSLVGWDHVPFKSEKEVVAKRGPGLPNPRSVVHGSNEQTVPCICLSEWTYRALFCTLLCSHENLLARVANVTAHSESRVSSPFATHLLRRATVCVV